jgi:hypothetical protein
MGQMEEAMRGSNSVADVRQDGTRRRKKRLATSCSICTSRIWFDPVHLMEPEGVPEPRLCWILCRECYGALLEEMRHSPVRSPLRLRIAMGLVASERWPQAYPTTVSTFINDRKWIIFIAVGFIVAMLLHLVLIVMIAGMK